MAHVSQLHRNIPKAYKTWKRNKFTYSIGRNKLIQSLFCFIAVHSQCCSLQYFQMGYDSICTVFLGSVKTYFHWKYWPVFCQVCHNSFYFLFLNCLQIFKPTWSLLKKHLKKWIFLSSILNVPRLLCFYVLRAHSSYPKQRWANI